MGLRDEWELFDVWFKEREGAPSSPRYSRSFGSSNDTISCGMVPLPRLEWFCLVTSNRSETGPCLFMRLPGFQKCEENCTSSTHKLITESLKLVLLSPNRICIQDLYERLPALCETVFHLRRSLRILFAMHQLALFQSFEVRI